MKNIGMSIEPEVDLGTLQKRPEIGQYFRYIKNKIPPIGAKWNRRVLNDYQEYYIQGDFQWHVSNMCALLVLYRTIWLSIRTRSPFRLLETADIMPEPIDASWL